MKIKKAVAVMLVAVMLAGLFGVSAAASAQTAVPSAHSVLVNGKPVAFRAFNIGGNNFFMLRDVAYALSGTTGRFDVTWDTARSAINLITSVAYDGAGLSTDADATVTATPSTAVVYVDGQRVDLRAYNIAGNNFFMLRDLGIALGFDVDFDRDTQTVIITTPEAGEPKDEEPDEGYEEEYEATEQDCTDCTELAAMSNPDLEQSLMQVASSFFQGIGNMGIAVGIIYDGEVLFINNGREGRGRGEVTENTIFDIASVTKPFTGIMLADLVNQGQLSLEDTMDMFFQTTARNVRLVDLATHTAGIPADVPAMDRAAFIQLLRTLRVSGMPGQNWVYSCLGISILGNVIEDVSGQSFNDFLIERIAAEIGMADTATVLSPEQLRRLAPAHDQHGNEIPNHWDLMATEARGGMNSTTYDLTRFMAAVLGDVPIGSELADAISLSMEIHWSGSQDMGLAWMIGSHGDLTTYSHGGGARGHTSFLIICPEINAGVVVLLNHRPDWNRVNINRLAFEIMDVLIAN